MNLTLDLNCDMGESFGAWKMGHDTEIMPYISSANIACGYHAGDPGVMRETVACALEHGVAIGAHPGLPDLQGFGRRAMQITEQEAYDMVVAQVGTLAGVAASQGTRLSHVKAHGMFYNMAVKDRTLARGIARAVHDVDKSLVFFGLAGSHMLEEAASLGLVTAGEVFGDRSYQPDGTLTPRSKPGAMITDVNQSIEQVLRMVKDGKVIAQDASAVDVKADTLCLHGDQPDAVAFAIAIRAALKEHNITVAPFKAS
jgi:UPF0271 protein